MVKTKEALIMDIRYKRVLLKISGEALAGKLGKGYDGETLARVAKQIADAAKAGAEIAVVVGGGNFWRGRESLPINRTTSDYMGMLATVMNAMCLSEAVESFGVKACVQTAFAIEHIAEPFNRKNADELLKNGTVVIFGGGTGCPFFSTDTTAALRAAEIGADMILLAKNVDGVYDSDPKTNADAKKFDNIDYMEFVSLNLKAMDTSAVVLCKENDIPVYVFALEAERSIEKALAGKLGAGTVIGNFAK